MKNKMSAAEKAITITMEYLSAIKMLKDKGRSPTYINKRKKVIMEIVEERLKKENN
jgi:hypothetical protein